MTWEGVRIRGRLRLPSVAGHLHAYRAGDAVNSCSRPWQGNKNTLPSSSEYIDNPQTASPTGCIPSCHAMVRCSTEILIGKTHKSNPYVECVVSGVIQHRGWYFFAAHDTVPHAYYRYSTRLLHFPLSTRSAHFCTAKYTVLTSIKNIIFDACSLVQCATRRGALVSHHSINVYRSSRKAHRDGIVLKANWHGKYRHRSSVDLQNASIGNLCMHVCLWRRYGVRGVPFFSTSHFVLKQLGLMRIIFPQTILDGRISF